MQPIQKTLIIADDLTGANDTGLQFANAGLAVRVVVKAGQVCDAQMDAAVSVVNTDTRALHADDAYRQLSELLGQRWTSGFDHVYKKIDSTLRGHIGRELDAMLDSGRFDLVVFAPAYPRNGRITVGGYHLVHTELLEDSPAARDPSHPVPTSSLCDIIALQSARPVRQISIGELRQGNWSELVQADLDHERCQLFAFDSVKQEDLEQVVLHVLRMKRRVLWVGSAGLAAALAAHVYPKAESPWSAEERRHDPHGSVLAVVGSVHPASRMQSEALLAAQYWEIRLHPAKLLQSPPKSILIDIPAGRDVLLTTEVGDSVRRELDDCCIRLGITAQEAGRRLAHRQGQLAAQALQSGGWAGAILTGGDVAAAVFAQLGVASLDIVDQAEEGVPICRAVGARTGSLLFVTKAGGFGSERTLLDAANRIKRSVVR